MKSLQDQIKAVETVDALVLLTGEPRETMPRSRHVVNLLDGVRKNRKSGLPVIVSGYWWGFKPRTRDFEPEYVGAARYLEANGVSPADIIKETTSLDTIANVYFSAEIAKQNELMRLGVVTQGFHDQRVRVIVDYMLHHFFTVLHFPAPEPFVPAIWAREKLLQKCIQAELHMHGVSQGYNASEYMRQWHPFHNHTGRPRTSGGPYSILCEAGSRLQRLQTANTQ